MKKVEIRQARKGFIVSATRGPMLVFGASVSCREAELIADAMARSDESAIVPHQETKVLQFPPSEWAAENLDEAIVLLRAAFKDAQGVTQ